MAMGFQSFIRGTSFDVLNSMSYNFVVDIPYVSGASSATYNLPGFVIRATIFDLFSTNRGGLTYNVSVSGQTVSWNVSSSCRLLITATPAVGSDIAPNFTFALYDYSAGGRTFKLAPNFTPYTLGQMIDITPAFGQLIQTNIPVGYPMIAFHRSMEGSGYDYVVYTLENINGFWGLRFRNNFGGIPMRACRIYLFSKWLRNIPDWGFFMYQPGTTTLVWHSNCLPLNILDGSAGNDVTSGNPLAVTSKVSSAITVANGPNNPGVFDTYFNCTSAGRNAAGNYACTLTLNFAANIAFQAPTNPGSWASGGFMYMDTSVYDTFGPIALG
ncbi:hypothetical protein Vid5_gp23 [Pantoea phage vB_PagS_Vid5]|uniref:Uncharacterized protein n=1 Tax=Pantoea phage vB_PagS_Vid5 TaxID=2099652 RepID=A0A2P1CKS0_9CAUD|nr:membrane associated protein [Pantoea phage vB_PagS_Vid5]AVJ51778.1 hypothetical protein Vid5_gp23 [Pantoea phage vB_PagS_Vid5]